MEKKIFLFQYQPHVELEAYYHRLLTTELGKSDLYQYDYYFYIVENRSGLAINRNKTAD